MRLTLSSASCKAPRTAASVSLASAMRSMRSARASGVASSASALVASMRVPASEDVNMALARTALSKALSLGSVSAASALSITGSVDSSAALDSDSIASARVATSLDSSLPAPSAASISLLMRLLLTTSSAPSGSLAGMPVAASFASSPYTMYALLPATLTVSAASASRKAGRAGSPLATNLCKASMRASLSPAEMAYASSAVSAWAWCRPVASVSKATGKARAARVHQLIRPEGNTVVGLFSA